MKHPKRRRLMGVLCLWLSMFWGFSESEVKAGPPEGERPSLANLQAQLEALQMQGRPFFGEIRVFSGNFRPDGWLYCNGLLLEIGTYPELFSVIGNTFGGDGRTTFGLPDLRGRIAMGMGAGAGLTNRKIGQKVGAESVLLSVDQLPAHDHTLRATNSAASVTQPAGNILAGSVSGMTYRNAATSVVMGSGSIGSTGSNTPHMNVQPSTVLNFIIAVDNRIARFPYTESTWQVEEGSGGGTSITTDYEFVSGGVAWVGMEYLLHDPNSGNVWVAIEKNHDLEGGPITPYIVLEPGGANMTESRPAPRWWVGPASGTAAAIATDYEFTSGGVDYIGLEYLALDEGVGSIWVAAAKHHNLESGPEKAVIVLDPTNRFEDLRGIPGPHWRVDVTKSIRGGLQFTSGGVDYIALEYLVDVSGIGTIWVTIRKSYDLEMVPETPRIVLCPDVVTPNNL